MLFKGLFGTQWSGSMAGATASHGRSGAYLRARVIPVNPNTWYQQNVRNIAGNLATAWVTSLTAIQRAAWTAYADQVAMTNRVGDTIYLTGLNHFVRSNTPRIQAGLTRIDDGPTIFALTDVTLPTFTISEATQQATIVYDAGDAWCIIDGGMLKIDLSRPTNPTINYFKGPYRYTDKVEGDTAVPPPGPAVVAVPFPCVTGQRVNAMFRGQLEDGRLSQPIRVTTFVLA